MAPVLTIGENAIDVPPVGASRLELCIQNLSVKTVSFSRYRAHHDRDLARRRQ